MHLLQCSQSYGFIISSPFSKKKMTNVENHSVYHIRHIIAFFSMKSNAYTLQYSRRVSGQKISQKSPPLSYD